MTSSKTIRIAVKLKKSEEFIDYEAKIGNIMKDEDDEPTSFRTWTL
jgi:hypothetical protein